eukprot:3644190-Pleurochrysis_carterae.AAC.1
MQRIAQQSGGLGFLVALRGDLVSALSDRGVADDSGPETERADWRGLDFSLKSLLRVWFDTGLLRLEELSWTKSPAALLEKLIRCVRRE